MMSVHDPWMQLALEQAHQAEQEGEVPVGAVLVLNNELIAAEHNRPIQLADPSAHAEIQVLRKAGVLLNNYRLPGSVLYVTLEPCLMCVGALVHARVEHCIFGAYDPKSGAVTSTLKGFDLETHNHQVEFTGGVLAEECGQVLKDFFKSRR